MDTVLLPFLGSYLIVINDQLHAEIFFFKIFIYFFFFNFFF